ncbi:DedA family protein [Microbacterium oryzae]|uniref:DedA family protein n=1 Tax=Microbacterium oryzae TaxID=743009 RepID=UPI0025B0C125|nr:DedA family protein [Microbacterium oryzae]MDN3311200.1 DedA family protein [Microbacterium oryzae]
MTTTEAAAGGGSWLSALVDHVVGLMDVIGPYGAGVAIAAENLFPPLPSEAILPLAGLAAQRGSFALWEAIVWTTVGSVVGALVLYGIGAWFGVDRLRWIAKRLPLISADDVDRTVAWFDRHGGKAVFFGRFVPIFRSLISIPAGVVRMPVWRFALYTAAGSVIWNTIFILLGWYLGSGWHIVEQYMDVVQNVVIVAVVVAVVWFVVVRLRALRKQRRAAATD